jgi:protein-disulfide isomerase
MKLNCTTRRWLSMILLGISTFSSSLLSAQGTPLFRLNGLDYHTDELSSELQQKLYDLDLERYNARKLALEDAIIEIYLEEQAERRNSSIEAVTAEFTAASRPSDRQVEEFYNANKDRINGAYNQVKPMVTKYLQEQEISGRKSRLIDRLLKSKGLMMTDKAPAVPVVTIDTQGYPAKGKLDSKVVMVEFADFQCPHCRHAHEAMQQLWPQYKDKIKLIYMDFPINASGISRIVAEGGVCADEQERYWPYNELAFGHQSELNKHSATAFAKELGLDMKQFESCLKQPATAAKVKASEDQARRLGISSTPTIYVNGKRLQIEDFHRDLTASFEAALQQATR